MDVAVVGQVIVVVASIVIVGAAIRLWARSASRPRRRRKGKDDGTRWRPDIPYGAGMWSGGVGGSSFGSGGDSAGGDGGGGCD